jgi:hypothetical protein
VRDTVETSARLGFGEAMAAFFEDQGHPTATYVAQIRGVRPLALTVK